MLKVRRILGVGAGGARPPPPRDELRFSNTIGILPPKKTMWFIGVEVEQETSAPPPKKNSGSAPGPSFQLQVKHKGYIERPQRGKKKDKYAHLELLYESSFEIKFPHIKTLELTCGCGSCLLSDMVLMSFLFLYISSAVTKVGGLFINQISAAALIRERRLFEKRRLIDHLR